MQADDVIPKQWMRWIGGLRTYAARLNFFLGVPNTLMIGVLFYNDTAALQAVFPTIFHWIGFLLLAVVPSAIAVDRILLHPAQIIYNQHQNGRENRSPNYRETMRTKRSVQRVHDRLDEAGVPQAVPDGGDEDDAR